MRVKCAVDCCVHNKDGCGFYEGESGCELEQIEINFNVDSSGLFVTCMDFEEKQDD